MALRISSTVSALRISSATLSAISPAFCSTRRSSFSLAAAASPFLLRRSFSAPVRASYQSFACVTSAAGLLWSRRSTISTKSSILVSMRRLLPTLLRLPAPSTAVAVTVKTPLLSSSPPARGRPLAV